jgi:transmembrane sensor
MHANEQRLQYLLDRYLHKTYTEAEKQEFLTLLNDPAAAEALQALNDRIDNLPQTTAVLDRETTQQTWQALAAVMREPAPAININMERRKKRTWWPYTVAAAIIVGVLVLGWLYIRKPPTDPSSLPQAQRFKNDVPPGRNGATLTLSDGKKILLDSAANGPLAKDGPVQMVKKDGQLTYEGQTQQMLYNQVVTARAQQWQLTLQDGTKVWLNAASSIRYPVAFTGNERVVEITGECYFEVATLRLRSGQKMPFRVIINKGAAIEVLGTHFNINAYEDEPDMKVTLLEGSVQVKSEVGSQKSDKNSQTSDFIPPNGGKTSVLKPGEQISISHTSQLSQPIPVQTEDAVAWKNGYFQFDNADLPMILRQLSRWYDINFRYEGHMPRRNFGGSLQRSLPLSNLLAILETNNIRFTIEGNTITVLP